MNEIDETESEIAYVTEVPVYWKFQVMECSLVLIGMEPELTAKQ